MVSFNTRRMQHAGFGCARGRICILRFKEKFENSKNSRIQFTAFKHRRKKVEGNSIKKKRKYGGVLSYKFRGIRMNKLFMD